MYVDFKHTIDKLPDEEAGKLLKHILAYVNDENPITDSLLVEIAFEPIKQQFKRDLEKYNNIVERNKRNGAKGGRPKTQTNPKEPKSNEIEVRKTIRERAEKFKESLFPYLDKYGKELLNEFYSYWSERGENDKKMRFEKQKSFGIERRLITWAIKSKEFNTNSKKGNVERLGNMNNDLDDKIKNMYSNE